MATLNDEQKRFIVERLACFDSPSDVRDELRETFGVELGLDHIVFYDPTTSNGRRLGKKWKAYFKEVRERFIEDASSIPIAIRSSRLRRLEKMAREAQRQKNYALVAQLLEQAAKEMGEAYTNRRVLDGRLRHSVLTLNPEDLEDAQIDELVDNYFAITGDD